MRTDDDLPETGADEALCLGHRRLHGLPAQHRPQARDDAVGAVGVAAVLYLEEDPLMAGEVLDLLVQDFARLDSGRCGRKNISVATGRPGC